MLIYFTLLNSLFGITRNWHYFLPALKLLSNTISDEEDMAIAATSGVTCPAMA